MSDVTATKSYVVISRQAAIETGRKIKRLEQIIVTLRKELSDNRALLESALIELGQARGRKDAQQYARAWLRQRRVYDDEGVPIVFVPRGEA